MSGVSRMELLVTLCPDLDSDAVLPHRSTSTAYVHRKQLVYRPTMQHSLMLGGIGGIAPLYLVGDKAEVEGGLFTYH